MSVKTKEREEIGRRIRKLRIEKGLSQAQVARAIGIHVNSYQLIENGHRKIDVLELKKLAEFLNVTVDEIIAPEKSPEVHIQKENLPMVKTSKIRINVPQKKLDKFKEVLLYVLNKVGAKPNVGETVLYKLLYFIDFNFYEKYEEQLIGATYIKNHYGPTPIEFKEIVKQMEGKDLVIIEDQYYQYPQRKYLPLRPPRMEILSGHELEVIDDVLERLSDMNATKISDYSHRDVPWLATPEGKPIDYELVFYRTPEYSVREYPEEEEKP